MAKLVNGSDHEGRRYEGRWGGGDDMLEDGGDKGLAGEDGHVLAEDLVVARPAAAEGVVVHAREVVVDEGHGVDHLHGTGRRPDSLSASEEGVAHGLVYDGRRFPTRYGLVQCFVHRRRLLPHALLEVERSTAREVSGRLKCAAESTAVFDACLHEEDKEGVDLPWQFKEQAWCTRKRKKWTQAQVQR